MSTNETIAEVLRLDAKATPGPWVRTRTGATMAVAGCGGSRGGVYTLAESAYPSMSADLIAYYRTAAPALAREVQRLQGQVETRDIIIYQVAWQMQAVATAIGMTPEEQAASAEGIGDAIAERVTRLQAERDAAHQDGYRAGQEAMRERCAALCDDWEEATYCDGWHQSLQAQHGAEARKRQT